MHEVADAFRLLAPRVPVDRVGTHVPRHDAKKGDAAGEGIVQRLEEDRADRRPVAPIQFHGLAAEIGRRDRRRVHRRGQELDHRVEQCRVADAVAAGGHGHREQGTGPDRGLEPLDQLLLGQIAVLEVGLHQLVVALRDRLGQLVAPVVDLVREFRWRVGGLTPAGAVPVVRVGLAAQQVDDAGEVLAGADRDLDGQGHAVEVLLEFRDAAGEVDVVAVHLRQVEHHRLLHLAGDLPGLFGHDLGRRGSVHAEECGVRRAHAGTALVDENPGTGAVDQIDLVARASGRPGRVADGEADRDAAPDFFVVEVGDRVPVFDPVLPVEDAAGVEQAGEQRRLA